MVGTRRQCKDDGGGGSSSSLSHSVVHSAQLRKPSGSFRLFFSTTFGTREKVGVANEVPLSRLLVKSFSPLIFFVHPTAARLLPASHKLLHT